MAPFETFQTTTRPLVPVQVSSQTPCGSEFVARDHRVRPVVVSRPGPSVPSQSQRPVPVPASRPSPSVPSRSWCPVPVPVSRPSPSVPSQSQCPVPVPVSRPSPSVPSRSQSPVPVPVSRLSPGVPSQSRRPVPVPASRPSPSVPSLVVCPSQNGWLGSNRLRFAPRERRTFCICVVSPLRARLAGAIDSGIIAEFPSPSRRLVVGSGSDGKPSAWEMCGSTQMSEAQCSTRVKSATCARNAKCSRSTGGGEDADPSHPQPDIFE